MSSSGSIDPLSFTLQLGSCLVTLRLDPYPLALRAAFGTSHSSSTHRTNALLTVQLGDTDAAAAGEGPLLGYGEVGLPPQKVGCYEATLETLRDDLQAFHTFLRSQYNDDDACDERAKAYNPFQDLPACYFTQLRQELDASTTTESIEVGALRHLFSALDTFLAHKRPASSDAAFCCLVEVALIDAWGRARRQLVCEMIGCRFDTEEVAAAAVAAAKAEVDATNATATNTVAPASSVSASASSSSSPSSSPSSSLPYASVQPRSFYTVGMDSLDQMLSNLDFGLRWTPLIKVKVDARLEVTREVLTKILARMEAQADPSFRLSVDANAAWSTPEMALACLDVLRPWRHHICMVEQPFPLFRACPRYIDPATATDDGGRHRPMQVVDGEYVDLDDATLRAWAAVAAAYAEAGLLLYADESICTAADLVALRPILHGVNVKLEKAGGYRGALRLLHAAQSTGVHTWLGCMVGSSLNSSQAAQLLPHSADAWGDLDGALLTRPESDRFLGGMTWTEATDRQRATGAMRIDNRAGGGSGVVAKPTKAS